MKGNRLNRQETAEIKRGIPVVQLDFLTGEYVGEYPSYSACSSDLDVPLSAILKSFSSKYCCVARITKYELLLIKKTAFEALKNTLV